MDRRPAHVVKQCRHKATATEQGYLLFFDIDGFKAINDNYGHDSGNEFVAIIGGETISKDNALVTI